MNENDNEDENTVTPPRDLYLPQRQRKQPTVRSGRTIRQLGGVDGENRHDNGSPHAGAGFIHVAGTRNDSRVVPRQSLLERHGSTRLVDHHDERDG